MKFKLLQGSHIQNETRNGEKVRVEYYARDAARSIVVSDIDLEKRFGSQKFQRLDGLAISDESALHQQLATQQAEIEQLKRQLQGLVQGPASPEEAAEEEVESADASDALDLEKLSVKELRNLAARESIDVSEAGNKAELINTIRSALDAQ